MKSRHLDKYMPRVVEGLDVPVEKRSNAATVLDRRDAERVPLMRSSPICRMHAWD
jgi:hypothetical protein